MGGSTGTKSVSPISLNNTRDSIFIYRNNSARLVGIYPVYVIIFGCAVRFGERAEISEREPYF